MSGAPEYADEPIGRSCGAVIAQFGAGAGSRPSSVRKSQYPPPAPAAAAQQQSIAPSKSVVDSAPPDAIPLELLYDGAAGSAIVLTMPDAQMLASVPTSTDAWVPPAPAFHLELNPITPDDAVAGLIDGHGVAEAQASAALAQLSYTSSVNFGAPSPAGSRVIVPLPVSRYRFGAPSRTRHDGLTHFESASSVGSPLRARPPRQPPPKYGQGARPVEKQPMFGARPVTSVPKPELPDASMVLPPRLPSSPTVPGAPTSPSPHPQQWVPGYGPAGRGGLPLSQFSMTGSAASSAAVAAVSNGQRPPAAGGPATMALRPLRSVGRFSTAVDPSQLSPWQYETLRRDMPDAAITHKATVHRERSGSAGNIGLGGLGLEAHTKHRRAASRPNSRGSMGSRGGRSHTASNMASRSLLFGESEGGGGGGGGSGGALDDAYAAMAVAAGAGKSASAGAVQVGHAVSSMHPSRSEPAFSSGARTAPLPGASTREAVGIGAPPSNGGRLLVTADASTLRARPSAAPAGGTWGGGAPAVARVSHTNTRRAAEDAVYRRPFPVRLLEKLEGLPGVPEQMVRLMRRGDWHVRGA